MPTEQSTTRTVAVTAIQVDERRREDYGDIASLAASIEKYGLLHPLVVDEDWRLVSGGRRLEAVKSLGWQLVDVRDFGELSEAERAEIELEENLQRKDLTPVERSKTLVKLAKTAKAVLQEQAPPRSDSERGQSGRFEKQPGSLRDVAERIGQAASKIVEAQQHVETVEKHPELSGPGWKQYHVLEARERLEKLPEPERPKAVALLAQPGIPPKDAIEMLGNLAAKPAEDRERIFQKAESADSRDRSDAITEAWDRPAMPDPRINFVGRAIEFLRKAEQMFAGDPMNSSLSEVRTAAIAVRDQLREYRHDA